MERWPIARGRSVSLVLTIAREGGEIGGGGTLAILCPSPISALYVVLYMRWIESGSLPNARRENSQTDSFFSPDGCAWDDARWLSPPSIHECRMVIFSIVLFRFT